MRHVLVTGGAGFIGSHIVKRLEEDIDTFVTVIDSSTNFDNLKSFRGAYIQRELVNVDLRSIIPLAGCSPSLIFHMAAITDAQETNRESIYKANIQAFYQIVEFAERFKIPVVYASSAGIYGQGYGIPMSESDVPEPLTYYAWSKMIMENIAQASNKKYKPYDGDYTNKFFGLRYFNVYGPGEDHKIGDRNFKSFCKFDYLIECLYVCFIN